MKIVYPFSLPDEKLALKNAEWMNELGGCHGHECLVIHDRRCDPELVSSIFLELTKAFDKVEIIKSQSEIDGWPQGANYFFRVVAAILQDKCPYFMWMEPDAIPLAAGWLDRLEDEYRKAGKLFMGDRVQVNDIPLHMSGVGIYPNPLHNHAGEAYRAHDIAWDMAARDQIVPKAHFTNLIEHAWKHPSFTSHAELATQIAPETILFHSSKDGSLIDLLRTAAPDLNQNSVPTEPTSGSPSREEIGTRAAQPSPICDIFIRTYPGDYQWLDCCLQSIAKFCTGFRKLWVVTPQCNPQPEGSLLLANGSLLPVQWKEMNDESPDGYLAQQITKLYADVITDYQPDHILHVDSDVIFTRPTTPGDFLNGNKVSWYYTPYSAIQTPWQPITEKFMGCAIPYEFMRRLPIMVPRWLYPKLREFAFSQHGMPIAEYIRMQPQRAFSEFNALGAYAYFKHRDQFNWQHTQEEGSMPAPLARQFHSWGGLTDEIRKEIEGILNGNETIPRLPGQMVSGKQGKDQTPTQTSQAAKGSMVPEVQGKPEVRDVRGKASSMFGLPSSGREEQERRHIRTGLQSSLATENHGGSQEMPDSLLQLPQEGALGGSQLDKTRPQSPKIKVLSTGVWVLEEDQISAWVEQEGRLDHDQNLLPHILKHISEGDTVVDAGAFIGDHTVAYFKAVGDMGMVHAFEPNAITFECLVHNVSPDVICHWNALGDTIGKVPISGNNGNSGGCYIGEHMKVCDARMVPLDKFRIAPDFIKIDVEGSELKLLKGAERTIMKCRPKMVIEINLEALKRQGATPGDIFKWLDEHGYDRTVIQENCSFVSPLYDILCLPAATPPEVISTAPAHTIHQEATAAPVVPTVREEVQWHVDVLKHISDSDPQNKAIVMQKLVYAGLKQPKPNKKKKPAKGNSKQPAEEHPA